MGTSLRDQLDEALGELQAHQRKMVEIRDEMRKATATVRSKDRTLSVTVGSRGEVREIAFHGDGYRRMAPAELSATLIETLNQAGAELAGRVRGAFGPHQHVGRRIRESMTGGTELDEFLAPLVELMRGRDEKTEDDDV